MLSRACAALVLGGTLAYVAPTSAREPSTVVFAQGIDPLSLDPAQDTTVSSISVMNNIYDTIIFRGPNGLEPGLAESWEYKDPLTLVLHLRKNVKFHDGSPFTAEDVAFTLKRYSDPKKQYQVLAQVKGFYTDVIPIDDYTVEIKTDRPIATLPLMLARLMVVSKKAVEAKGDNGFGQAPVGTGAYKFVEWKKNERIVMEAFPDYWRGKAKVDRFIVRPIPEDYSRFAALKAGEVDVVAGLPAERVGEVKSDPNLKIASARSVRNYSIAMNVRNKPFDDVRVRQALNYAVDISAIIDAVFDGQGYANGTVCAGLAFGHDENIKPYTQDIEKAKKLLAEAGYPNGFTTELWGPVGRYPKDKEVQEAVAGQLAEVGVIITHQQPEWQVFVRKYLNGEVENMGYMGVGNPTLDCDYSMGQRVDVARGGRYFPSPEVSALIKAEQSELDATKRAALFSQIQRIMHDQAAWIFLFDGQDIYGTTARLVWQPRSDEVVWAYDMSLSK
jgi:peptide/nickel transport system substrate-binding protein